VDSVGEEAVCNQIGHSQLPKPSATHMYSHNPYGAAVQDISESKLSAGRSASDRPADPFDSSAGNDVANPSEKQRDAVLSRVPKRALISKPPVKISMAPRYRFAIPEPPADLKMLRGPLTSSPSAACHMHKLEVDAKKVALPIHPSFSLHTDLVTPAQYTHRNSSVPLSADDQVILESVGALSATKASASSTQGGSGVVKKTAQGSLGAPGAYSLSSGRLPIAPPNRSKQTTAHPWMRRMSYDEYFSGTNPNDPRRQAALVAADATAQDVKQENFTASRKRDAVESFEKANIRSLKHPDKNKANLRARQITPVFRDISDTYNAWVSMQFDRTGPMDKLPRFEGSSKLAEEAFRSAVTISVADMENKKFLSCYVPDGETLGDEEGNRRYVTHPESHERIREFSIREAGLNVVSTGPGSANTIRAKRTFVMTSAGDGDSSVVFLSEVPSSFLLAQRQGILEALSRPRLELTRDPDTSEAKRRRINSVVDTLCG
jgi:hypothetical protein